MERKASEEETQKKERKNLDFRAQENQETKSPQYVTSALGGYDS
uniref:Uncharacterized protein n=1 Tax=Rhizophora mucronata TaxID=61149 RepID=A0A2P2NT49_RHIMU